MIFFSMSKAKALAEKTGIQPLVLLSDEPTKDYHADGLNMLGYANVVAGAAIGTRGPFTIGVFGKWGEGKSSVLRQALSLIDESVSDAICVWFNAWQYDHEPYPIVPLALTIAEKVDREIPESNKHENASRWITLREIGTALRALASGLTVKAPFLDIDVKAILSELDRSTGATDGEPLRPGLYQKAFGLLQAASATPAEETERPPIVVFIDDLDRCMPQHALRLLQAIRLVLSQPGFIFVLALDRDPIVHYLTREYEELGMEHPELSARSYLDKMVQLPLWLPPHKERFSGFIDTLLKRDELKHHTVVMGAVSELREVLTKGTEANPRAVVRLINSLIADQFLWSARGREADTRWLGFCAISRVLHDRLGEDDYRCLIPADEFCEELAEAESTSKAMEKKLRKYEGAKPESVSKAQQAERKLLERIVGSPVVQALLGTKLGGQWLKDHAARREIDAYLAPEQRQADESAGYSAEAIERAIRTSLDLDAKQPITPDVLKRVSYLNLQWDYFADGDLAELKNMISLTTLNLAATRVTNAGLEHLKGLTSLSRLDLWGTQVMDAGLEHLKGLTSLSHLDLGGTRVTDAGLEHLKGLTALTDLGLVGTQVTDAGLEHLKGLTALTDLGLGSTRVTNAGLEHLKGLTALTDLGLGDTQVTDAGKEALERACPHIIIHG